MRNVCQPDLSVCGNRLDFGNQSRIDFDAGFDGGAAQRLAAAAGKPGTGIRRHLVGHLGEARKGIDAAESRRVDGNDRLTDTGWSYNFV